MIIRLSSIVVLVFLASLLTQCASASPRSTSPTPAVPPTAPKAAPTIAPDATEKAQNTDSSPKRIASDSVQMLSSVDSYQFSVSSVLRTTFENKPREWKYSGTGAVSKPSKFQWTIEGQADTFFTVVSVGGQTYCADARGENKDCSLAFGGPRPGASPYTIISYLQNFDQVGTLATKTIQGKDYDYFTFSPSLQKVGSLDAAHAKAVASVASVTGEVWIDKNNKLPYQERVILKYKSQAAGEETVETTITFQKYNQPVDIKLPK